MLALQAGLGLLVFVAIAWLLSEHKTRFPWREVLAGLALQFGIAVLLLSVPGAQHAFLWLNQVVIALTDATQAGTSFVFGYIGGDDPPFAVDDPANNFILAFQALPLVLVLSALSALLFYWRVLPVLIRGASLVLQRAFGIGGALGVGTASNVFLSMVESPLVIRPYLRQMNRSELFALMSVGMATLAGTMLVLYSTIIGTVLDDALGHLIVASLISLPAALLIATVMIPPTAPSTAGDLLPETESATSAMDAITRGTLRGLELLLQIIALLIVVIALVALVNVMLGALPEVAGAALSLERILGWVFAPLAWLMGIPWAEATTAGSLLGVKTILNEMVAFLQMAELGDDALSARSELILIYALSGFANLGSLGILIGGLGALVPERRSEIVSLGIRAIVAGTLATLMTGAVVGIVHIA
ncbi:MULTISPECIES: NupC/NupG family nucleoside CNT transporter [unclassified Thioalkalivibrio]|uniref:NupC/NupG family nucleoside CNT transporter n=1 Tax=unclassified Thioalkalivibrio TaxID=2621013 RepID=UPI000375DA68|nr:MULTISPECIES: nucleoside transporter C-terminal domain-containing protein [unclassified Thioalkalivibrio]